MSVTLVRVP